MKKDAIELKDSGVYKDLLEQTKRKIKNIRLQTAAMNKALIELGVDEEDVDQG